MSNTPSNDTLAQDFVAFAVQSKVLRFGEFKTKAGRLSPYFFNAGLFDDGAKLGRLAEFYARRLIDSGVQFDHASSALALIRASRWRSPTAHREAETAKAHRG